MKKINYKDNKLFPKEDGELLDSMKGKFVSEREEKFFYNVIWKEVYEWAGDCDVLMSEFDNDDEVYIVRYFDSEYEIGKGRIKHHGIKGGYCDSLSELLKLDMFNMTGEHTSILEWLRKKDYQGIRYDQNQED